MLCVRLLYDIECCFCIIGVYDFVCCCVWLCTCLYTVVYDVVWVLRFVYVLLYDVVWLCMIFWFLHDLYDSVCLFIVFTLFCMLGVRFVYQFLWLLNDWVWFVYYVCMVGVYVLYFYVYALLEDVLWLYLFLYEFKCCVYDCVGFVFD